MPVLSIGPVESRLPIIQGGMAVRISMAPLAAAVANEGGIGIIAASGLKPAELVDQIRKAKQMTTGPIGVNVMVAVQEFAALVKAAIVEKVDVLIAGAGFSRDAFKWCKSANIAFLPIVSSVRVAKLAERFGASGVILEGKEAGGHLGSLESTWDLLPKLVEAVRVPVIAAGGILTGQDIRTALDMGASGVQMGSRFAVSEESNAAIEWKQACINATADDVVLVKSPVGLPGRALRTAFVKRLENDDLPDKSDTLDCGGCLKKCGKDYCIILALIRAQRGDMERGLVFCGERIGEIKEILSVAAIMKRLRDQFEEGESQVGAFA